MKNNSKLTMEEKKILTEKGVDVDLSIEILENYNQGISGKEPPVIPVGVPEINGQNVLDLKQTDKYSFTEEQLIDFEKSYPEAFSYLQPGNKYQPREDLIKAGTALLPYFSYGFLNGGSATSYSDHKKNKGFSPELYEYYRDEFDRMANLSKGKPKGVTPAFIQQDGQPGPTYMELKLRALLLMMKSYNELTGKKAANGIPFFQMTSVANDKEVKNALELYRESPWLKNLARSLNLPAFESFTAAQPLITAYTHSNQGDKKDFFRSKENDFPFLTLPGGHGQCFRVLKETWEELHRKGIRFISIGNIDNLGYLPDPLELALLAIRNSPAGFDESYKTDVDIKGGILVNLENGSMSCVDLGVGISFEEADALESKGKRILFNCGSGLFNLSWLLENLDEIIKKLPLRFSDQNKDAGLYSQAEQVTWEVIGMIDAPLIFAVDKYERFLAAKILMENIMTSGLRLDDLALNSNESVIKLTDTAKLLHKGLSKLLESRYGLLQKDGNWCAD